MKKLYGKLNRYRGSENKLLGILGLWGIPAAACVVGVFARPDVLGFGSTYQTFFFLLLSLIGFLCTYKFFWGSAAFPQDYDTLKEVEDGELLGFAKDYADKKLGYTYTATLNVEKAIAWKAEAHKAVCVFRYTLGYLLIGIATLNPFLVILGVRGFGVAETYREEFEIVDQHILHRAEIKIGEGDFNYMVFAVILTTLQTIAMCVWM